jgi:hypothetical protein
MHGRGCVVLSSTVSWAGGIIVGMSGGQAAVAILAQQRHQLGDWFPRELQPQHVLCTVCPMALGVPGAPELHKGMAIFAWLLSTLWVWLSRRLVGCDLRSFYWSRPWTLLFLRIIA